MWMQLLNVAGFPPIGTAFPRDWENTLKDANPAGFWESELRKGIYYATNPAPRTGTYLFPEDTRRHAVKVFIPGLIKTDRAFIDGVIVTVRPWRQYVRSLRRLYAIEREAKRQARAESANEGSGDDIPDPVFFPPMLEWWMENFSLISDIVTRRYPFYMVSYNAVVEKPEQSVRGVFDWLKGGDVEAAIAHVQPPLRTQGGLQDDSVVDEEGQLEPEVIEVFDQLFQVVHAQKPLTQAFVDRLNEINNLLTERIQVAVKETTGAQIERRKVIQAKRQERADFKASAESD